MNFTRKATFLLLLLVFLAPFSARAIEDVGDSHGDVATISHHDEVCFSPGSANFTSEYVLSSMAIAEVNESVSLDFSLEVMNVTQNNASTALSQFDVSWNYIQVGNASINSVDGLNATLHLSSLTSEVQILWSIVVGATNNVGMDRVCVNAIFDLHVDHSAHQTEEKGITLGNLAITLVIVFAVPSVLLVAFNRFS